VKMLLCKYSTVFKFAAPLLVCNVETLCAFRSNMNKLKFLIAKGLCLSRYSEDFVLHFSEYHK